MTATSLIYTLVTIAGLISLVGLISGAGLGPSLLVFIVMSAAAVLYFFPTIQALKQGKRNAQAIAILNTTLGWTLVGWVVALVWAVAKDSIQVEPQSLSTTRTCPYCTEFILPQAIKCKHCGSDLTMQ